jgi:hypothetical protein
VDVPLWVCVCLCSQERLDKKMFGNEFILCVSLTISDEIYCVFKIFIFTCSFFEVLSYIYNSNVLRNLSSLPKLHTYTEYTTIRIAQYRIQF